MTVDDFGNGFRKNRATGRHRAAIRVPEIEKGEKTRTPAPPSSPWPSQPPILRHAPSGVRPLQHRSGRGNPLGSGWRLLPPTAQNDVFSHTGKDRLRSLIMLRRVLLLTSPALALALLGLAGPTPAPAQERLTVRVVPRAGLLSPDAYFYEEFANFADDEPDEWTNGSLGRAAYVAVAAEVGYEDRGIFLRGELGHTFEGWLAVTHAYVRPRVLLEPPVVIYTYLDVPASITFAKTQLVLPTRFQVAGIKPYAFLGGGGKWYHFGSPTEENTVDAILPAEGFTGSFELGGGVLFSLVGLTFDLQILDSVNRYWGKTQHDLVFTGGWVWRIR